MVISSQRHGRQTFPVLFSALTDSGFLAECCRWLSKRRAGICGLCCRGEHMGRRPPNRQDPEGHGRRLDWGGAILGSVVGIRPVDPGGYWCPKRGAKKQGRARGGHVSGQEFDRNRRRVATRRCAASRARCASQPQGADPSEDQAHRPRRVHHFKRVHPSLVLACHLRGEWRGCC